MSTSVPSAASFYVPNLPGLHEDSNHPLHIYAGHIESDPNVLPSDINVSAHLFFVLVKARKTADKERVMFWFNVGCITPFPFQSLMNVLLYREDPVAHPLTV